MSPLVTEKDGYLPVVGQECTTDRRRGVGVGSNARRYLKLASTSLLLLTVAAAYRVGLLQFRCYSCRHSELKLSSVAADVAKDLCYQPRPLVPSKNGELWKSLGAQYGTATFQTQAVKWLSGAVQVP